MKNIAIAALLIASASAYAQQVNAPIQRPSDAMMNGRIESIIATRNAALNECAIIAGNLYDALENAAHEILKLRAELDAGKK